MGKRESISEKAWPEIAHFARRVADVRAEKNISQNELARITGLTQSYLATVESCKANPSHMVMAQIARGLRVSLSSLTSGAIVQNDVGVGDL